ncbi:MAG: S-layer homology domain-containing protein, partial [Clostridiales bacterium]|nr:S-layer homology domain-containing protein [Clostridiales bacterium]
MKRLISMLLAAMMIISMVATTAMAVSSELPFEDVAIDAWYYQHVKDAYTMDLMHGQSSVKFAPEVSMKRSELVKILANIAGLTDEELQSKNYAAEAAKKFTDVKEDDWFASFVGWANSQDILRGYETGDVRPNNSASRQEIAVMFGRFMKAISFNWKAESETPDSLFTDNDEVADWAYYEVYLLKAMNVISGYEGGSFRPTKPMLRSEIAKVAAEFVKFRNNELDESIPETPELSITAEADAVVTAEELNALTGALNTNKYFTSVSIANSDDALAKIAAVEPGNSAEIDLKVVFESVKYSSDRTYKLNLTRKPVAEVPNPEVPGGLTFSYTAEADENVILDKISAIVNAEANADGK